MSCFKTEKSAVEVADAVAKRLSRNLGGEWETRVHQNCGWHASVILGAVCVFITPHMDGDVYSVMVSDSRKFPGVGCPEWSVRPNDFDTPEDAARAGLAKALEELGDVIRWVYLDTLAKIRPEYPAHNVQTVLNSTEIISKSLKNK